MFLAPQILTPSPPRPALWGGRRGVPCPAPPHRIFALPFPAPPREKNIFSVHPWSPSPQVWLNMLLQQHAVERIQVPESIVIVIVNIVIVLVSIVIALSLLLSLSALSLSAFSLSWSSRGALAKRDATHQLIQVWPWNQARSILINFSQLTQFLFFMLNHIDYIDCNAHYQADRPTLIL